MKQHYLRIAPTARNPGIAIFIALLVTLSPAGADQSDLRLDGLFAQLHGARNPAIAKRAEGEIWAIWHETPDGKSLEIMRAARRSLDAGDFATAVKRLDELVAYAPDFAEAWNQRAIVSYLAEDYTGALHDIERTLALEPRHFGALSGRGQVYLQLEELEMALESFELALDRNPWMDNVRNQMEMIRAQLNARPQPI
ncbi:MAG: tetratricopeptide repeat protein [Gammaproteobacteria bacterium]